MAVAARGRHLARGEDVDDRRCVDAVDEVARHRRLEVGRPHDHHHPPGVLGHVERRLPRGVGRADDVDVVVDDLARVAGVGAVVDAAAGECVEPLRLQAAVGDAGRDDHRAGLDRRTTVRVAVEHHRTHRPPLLERDHVAGQHHLGAEPLHLRHRPVGQVGAAEALGEAQVVLDRGARAGLATGSLPLDHDRAQPLGRRVDRRGQAGGTAADDAHVVQRLPGLGAQAERAGQLDGGGGAQRVALRRQHEGQVVGGHPGQLREALALLVELDVEPAVGHVVAGQERLHLVAAVGPPVVDDPDVGGLVGVLGVPVAEQVVDDGVEVLLRRVPRLEQVVVEPDVVDRRDGHTRVGVRREQQPLGALGEAALLGGRKRLDAGHLRHPLVDRDQGDGPVAQGQLRQHLQCLLARGGTHDPVVAAVAAPQVTADGGGNLLVVVDGQDGGPRHLPPQEKLPELTRPRPGSLLRRGYPAPCVT